MTFLKVMGDCTVLLFWINVLFPIHWRLLLTTSSVSLYSTLFLFRSPILSSSSQSRHLLRFHLFPNAPSSLCSLTRLPFTSITSMNTLELPLHLLPLPSHAWGPSPKIKKQRMHRSSVTRSAVTQRAAVVQDIIQLVALIDPIASPKPGSRRRATSFIGNIVVK